MSITEQVINDKITKYLYQLNQMTGNKGSAIFSESEFKEEIQNQELLEKNLDERILDAKLEQIYLSSLSKKLKDNFKLNQLFIQSVDHPLIKQILTNARLEELKSVKIVRKGKSYYINELVNSFYGKVIISGIDSISPNRKSLNRNEYDLVKTQCLRIKLELPEEIEPTNTEKFFNDEMEGE